MKINVNLLSNNSTNYYYIFLCLIVSCFLFSPFFLFLLSVLSFLVLTNLLSFKFLRYIFIFFTLWSGLVIVGSRLYSQELGYDLSIYHYVFEGLRSNPIEYITYFGGGFEVGWPLIYYFLGLFFDLSPIHLALVNTLLAILLIIIWIEKKIKPNISSKEIGLMYFLFFIFLNFIELGFLERQALTLGILLFALTAKNNRNLTFFIILAAFFHLSSILIGLIIYFSRKITLNKINILLIFVFIVFLRLFFSFILLSFLSFFSFFDPIVHKLNFFKDADFQISTLRYTILFAAILIVLYMHQCNNKFKYIYNYAVLSAIFIISFVGIPLFADRIFMMGMIIYGLLYYLFFYKKYPIVSLFFALIYFIVSILERANIIGGLADGDYYWARFECLGYDLLYYLGEI